MADAEFDVSDGALRQGFMELTKPDLGPNDRTIFAAKREKTWVRRSSIGGRSFILQDIIGDAAPAEFTVSDHRFHDFHT